MANPTITGNGPNSRTTLQNIHSGERSFQKDLATVHSQVALMQTALTNKGYNTYGADGKFGDNTLNAVKAFQRAYGLTADGYFGKNSLLKLEQLIGGHLDPTPGGCTVSGTGGGGGSGTYIGQGTVIGGRLYCRKQPQAGYAYWGQFENGTVIALYTCSTNGWYETRWPVGGSSIGYVMSQYVSLNGGGGDPPLPQGLFFAKVNTSGGTLNVRNSPSTGGILGVWPNGRIAICEESGTSGWYKTRYSGQTAYVDASFMTVLTTQVQNNYPERILTIYPPEIGKTNAAYYDNAYGQWCQLFVNWLLRATYLSPNRVPTTSGTGYGIQFWVNNAEFYFKSAVHKSRVNAKYSLGVGSTLTPTEESYIPAVGDVIYFKWSNVTDPDVVVSHTGIVTSVEGGYVHTVEGNKAGAVGIRSMALTNSQIVGYGKPNYSF